MHQKIKMRVEIEMHTAYVTEVTNMKEDLHNGFEFCDWKEQVKTDSTVFVKPNFTFPYYKERITTSLGLLKNLLAILKDRPDNVIVGESDGGNRSFSADEAFKGHNMIDLFKRNLHDRPMGTPMSMKMYFHIKALPKKLLFLVLAYVRNKRKRRSLRCRQIKSGLTTMKMLACD